MNNIYERRFKEERGEDPISPNCTIGANVRIGFNVIIDPGCMIGDNVFIGNNSMIRSNVYIGKDSIIGHLVVIESDTVIGEKVTIQSQCHITKNAVIEDQCFWGPMAMCINTQKISHGRKFKAKLEGPHVGFGCRIGAGARLMPGIKIGDNATVGVGAVVTDNVPENQIWFGLPARFKGITPKRERLEKDEQKE